MLDSSGVHPDVARKYRLVVGAIVAADQSLLFRGNARTADNIKCSGVRAMLDYVMKRFPREGAPTHKQVEVHLRAWNSQHARVFGCRIERFTSRSASVVDLALKLRPKSKFFINAMDAMRSSGIPPFRKEVFVGWATNVEGEEYSRVRETEKRDGVSETCPGLFRSPKELADVLDALRSCMSELSQRGQGQGLLGGRLLPLTVERSSSPVNIFHHRLGLVY
ncbi:uncharacterized protein EI90DRAFT_3292202 [Cantharellus anzutake]|uniref:uncharacterized protein n=1 Tax=Cantharellus anzutake TaxID=1750568 RepID=UPI001903B2C5|nr:uncharacterized protein EI90DRAFT_3292202 [Cantharellus anzutake]KAF8324293.1 hypothetical protein EI90DRAFT_3292202 [Cantharellus anzutake]